MSEERRWLLELAQCAACRHHERRQDLTERDGYLLCPICLEHGRWPLRIVGGNE